MPLLLQAAGIVAASALLAALATGRSGARPVPPSTAVIAVFAAVLAIGTIWPAARHLLDRREDGARLGAREAAAAGGIVSGQPVAGLDLIRARLGRGDTFHVLPRGPAGDPTRYQWTAYQLAPNRSVGRPGDADWLVLHGVPRRARYDRDRFGEPIPVTPRLFLVPRRSGR